MVADASGQVLDGSTDERQRINLFADQADGLGKGIPLATLARLVETPIRVTDADIQDGDRFHPTRSPVALALQRRTGLEWVVSPEFARTSRRGLEISLPPEVYWRIIDFDRGRDGGPFSFRLSVQG